MNTSLPLLDLSVRKIQTQSIRKESSSKNKFNFEDILKGTQPQLSKNDTSQAKNNTQEMGQVRNTSIRETNSTKGKNEVLKSGDELNEMPSEEEIIEVLEQSTGLSKEEIQEALDVLGITVYDLFLPPNLQEFIQKITGVKDPVDLLIIPNVNKMYKDITNGLDEIKEKFPNIQNTTLQGEETNQADKIENFIDTNIQQDTSVDNSSKSNETFSQGESKNQNEFTEEAILKEEISKEPKERIFKENSSIIEIEQEQTIITNNNGEIIQQNAIVESKIVDSRLDQIKNAPVEPEQIIKQMVDNIKVNIKEDLTEMNLKLKPDHLGDLSLKIVSERGIITAQFIAESQAVKEIIETNFNVLKNVLEEQGIKIQNLEVSVKQEFDGQKSNLMQNRSSKSHKRISSIISNITEESMEVYDMESNNPYILSESEIDFSA